MTRGHTGYSPHSRQPRAGERRCGSPRFGSVPHPEPRAWMLTHIRAGLGPHAPKGPRLEPAPGHSPSGPPWEVTAPHGPRPAARWFQKVLGLVSFSLGSPRGGGSMGSGSFEGATGAGEPAPCALPGRGPRAAVPALVTGDAPGLPASTVVPLEGVLGRDLPSPFFFLSFLYPEKTDFHRDLGLAAASSRALGLGLSGGRPSPLGFFSFLFLLGEKRDDRS